MGKETKELADQYLTDAMNTSPWGNSDTASAFALISIALTLRDINVHMNYQVPVVDEKEER